MHISTYDIDSGTSLNFIQEYVNITLSIVSKVLYLWLLLFIFNVLYAN